MKPSKARRRALRRWMREANRHRSQGAPVREMGPRTLDAWVALFLDGRTTPDEREKMLEQLNVDDDVRKLVADTAALLRELEEEDAAGGPPRA